MIHIPEIPADKPELVPPPGSVLLPAMAEYPSFIRNLLSSRGIKSPLSVMGNAAYRQLMPQQNRPLFIWTEIIRQLIDQKLTLTTSAPAPNGCRPQVNAFTVGCGLGYRLRLAHYAPANPPIIKQGDELPCVFGLPSNTQITVDNGSLYEIDEVLDHLHKLVDAEILRDSVLEEILLDTQGGLVKNPEHHEYLALGTGVVSRSLAMAEALAVRRTEVAAAIRTLGILDAEYGIPGPDDPPRPVGVYSQAEFELCFPELGEENPH